MVVDYLGEIVGQDTAKRFIRTAIKKDNLYNFLFAGPKGVGKRSLGFALAKTLRCPPASSNFILVAPIPSRIKNKEEKIFEYTKRYLPDNPVVDIEDRTSILIEQIRSIIERLVHMPNLDSKRVVLILEADTMTDEAANCFLKTLEEPPLDTVFILTTSRPNFVLPTIRSRCQIIPFNYLSNDHITNIVFEGEDTFQLGSAGEILLLQHNDYMDFIYTIFKHTPLDTKTAALRAKELERKKVINILYPLLLLYRLVLYKKLNIDIHTSLETMISKKAERISIEDIIQAVKVLNQSIYSLEQNPNRLLLLFNTLSTLP
jgi:DNA polymerase III delta prime subunit